MITDWVRIYFAVAVGLTNKFMASICPIQTCFFSRSSFTCFPALHRVLESNSSGGKKNAENGEDANGEDANGEDANGEDVGEDANADDSELCYPTDILFTDVVARAAAALAPLHVRGGDDDAAPAVDGTAARGGDGDGGWPSCCAR